MTTLSDSRSLRTLLLYGVSLATIATSAAQGALVEWEVSAGGNGHFYEAILSPGPINWQTARNDAISKGGELVSISSASENSFVFGLIDAPEYWVLAGPHNFGPWIGAYQVDSSSEPAGNWAWSDATAWGHTSWASGQPDNAGLVEDHAHYFVASNSRNSTWNDWTGGGLLIKAYVLETLSASADGDFDGNGTVDGFDFLEWQIDPDVGLLSDWELNYGASPSSHSGSVRLVPEPTTAALTLAALCLAVNRRRAF